MSGSADNDILVYFVRTANSDPIQGESTSVLSDTDSGLMDGFQAGRYSEAEDFSFSIKLGDDESSVGAALEEERSFARWRGLSDASLKPEPPFRAEPDEVSFRRMIDVSSPILLEYCLGDKPLASVVMVKRARRGTQGDLTVVLRMEFTKVWIQAITWRDGDTVVETCKFKFLSFVAKYVKFKPSGAPDSTVNCDWTGVVART